MAVITINCPRHTPCNTHIFKGVEVSVLPQAGAHVIDIQIHFFSRASCRIRQAFDEIMNSKCHRADVIVKKRNWNRLKKVCNTKEEEIFPGYYTIHNRAEYATTHELVSEIVDDLTFNGFSVINDFIDAKCMNNVRRELAVLYSDTGLVPGKLCQAGYSAASGAKAVRSDMVRWLEVKHDCPYTAIHSAVRSMDRISYILNTTKILSGCDIRSRSPAMLACYPAKTTGYKKHVDNPNQDGRKLTFIIYTNKDYDRIRDGGVLRIHNGERRKFYDIEPIDGRLVIFWSDSRVPHEVLPTTRDRYAISVWYFDLVERARTLVQLPPKQDRNILQTCFLP